MEFKAYKSLKFYIPIEWEGIDKINPNWGSVKLLRGKFGKYPRNSIIPFKVLHDYYYTKKNEKAQAKFDNALEESGYWYVYPEIKDEFKDPAPIIGTGDEENDERSNGDLNDDNDRLEPTPELSPEKIKSLSASSRKNICFDHER